MSGNNGLSRGMDGAEDTASHSTSSYFAKVDKSFREQTDFARMHYFKQQAAWWKSQYIAAQYENKALRAALDQIYNAPTSGKPSSFRSPKRKKNKLKRNRARLESVQNINSNTDESEEFEISEEFRQFLDANRQHKESRELKKATDRKARGSESESELIERMEQEPHSSHERYRQEQLKLLYGNEWRNVEGLETQVQMNYDQFCDTNKPDYWPNIAMNL